MAIINPPTYDQDPDDVLDYYYNWVDWLADGEVITSSVFTAGPGITIQSQSNTTQTTTVWIKGGEIGQTYRITNRVQFTTGRQVDRSINIRITDR